MSNSLEESNREGILAVLDENMPEKEQMVDIVKGGGRDHCKVRRDALRRAATPPEGTSDIEELYALTLTLNPRKKLRSVDDSAPREAFCNIGLCYDDIIYNDIRKYTLRYLKRCRLTCTIIVEYTKALDLHFHGIMKGTKTEVSRFKKWWHRNYGFTTIKPIFELQDWIKYCMKDQSEIDFEPIYNLPN